MGIFDSLSAALRAAADRLAGGEEAQLTRKVKKASAKAEQMKAEAKALDAAALRAEKIESEADKALIRLSNAKTVLDKAKCRKAKADAALSALNSCFDDEVEAILNGELFIEEKEVTPPTPRKRKPAPAGVPLKKKSSEETVTTAAPPATPPKKRKKFDPDLIKKGFEPLPDYWGEDPENKVTRPGKASDPRSWVDPNDDGGEEEEE